MIPTEKAATTLHYNTNSTPVSSNIDHHHHPITKSTAKWVQLLADRNYNYWLTILLYVHLYFNSLHSRVAVTDSSDIVSVLLIGE